MKNELIVDGVVIDISKHIVRVLTNSPSALKFIHDIEADCSIETACWIIPYADRKQLASILMAAREAGFAFMGGESGWPPAAIVASLKEDNLFYGSYFEIVWQGSDKPVTYYH